MRQPLKAEKKKQQLSANLHTDAMTAWPATFQNHHKQVDSLR